MSMFSAVWSRITFGVLFILIAGITGAGAIVAISPETAWGTLHVDGVPTGMTISLDGVASGVVPESGVLVLDQVPLGGHLINAAAPGFQAKDTQVDVLDGQITKARIELTPISTGTLAVSSNPTNVQVYLDDVYKGITPVTLTDVPIGGYTVLLRLAGYQDWSSPVSVTAGGEQVISGNLVPVTPPAASVQPPAAPTPSAGGFSGIGILGVLAIMAGYCVVRRR